MKRWIATTLVLLGLFASGVASAQWSPSNTTQVEPVGTITVYGSVEDSGGEGVISFSAVNPYTFEQVYSDPIELVFWSVKEVQVKCVGGSTSNVTSRSSESDRQEAAQAALNSSLFPAIQRFLGMGSFRIIFADGGFEEYTIMTPGYALKVDNTLGLRDGNPNNESCHAVG